MIRPSSEIQHTSDAEDCGPRPVRSQTQAETDEASVA